MPVQQIAAPSRGIRGLIVVALLLSILAVGAVTAVKLFPASASGQAAGEATGLIQFRAGERASVEQGSASAPSAPTGAGASSAGGPVSNRLDSEYLRSIAATWGTTSAAEPVRNRLDSEYLRSIAAGW